MGLEYCRYCHCPDCKAVTAAKLEQERREREYEERQEAKRLEAEQRAAEVRAELLRQACMIWMLVNTCSSSWDAKGFMNRLAYELDISPGVVNQRRMIYAQEMRRRSGVLDFQGYTKIPGTVGTELPDWCPMCGGMKTQGSSCKRRRCREL